jgi:hypothetical protein
MIAGFAAIAIAIVLLAIWIKIRYLDYRFYTPIILPLKSKFKKPLQQYFPYYQGLNEKEKRDFERRVQYFIDVKEFYPRNMEAVTDEMKALISASAIQLTFGLPNIFLAHFKRILIYPDTFFSTTNQQMHKGEVNPGHRIIVVSWNNFVSGYIELDGINLGLHEMAHALHLENRIMNNEYGFFDEAYIEKWNQLSGLEIEKIRKNKNHFFREYAGNDMEEFFAVAVEYFFETPKAFKENLPELYDSLSKLLNQDPASL